jgi:hypothetical protein
MNGAFCECEGEVEEVKRLVALKQQSEIGNMRYYAHSHVDMGVRGSSHDYSESSKTMNEAKSFVVTGIFNNKGKYQFDIYDYEKQIHYIDVETHTYVENMRETLIMIANTAFKEGQSCMLDSNFFNDNTICNRSNWDYMTDQYHANVLEAYNDLAEEERSFEFKEPLKDNNKDGNSCVIDRKMQ